MVCGFFLQIFAMALCFNSHVAIQDYCSLHTYATNETFMQFTKEPNIEEFAIVGKFKGLHCCAKGYRSIEWYKDGKLYPWPLTQSQLILYPESANQTVYTKRVTEVDAGNYTCLLRNDSVVHSHTIQLIVFEKIPDDPKITYVSPDSEVSLGHNLRLFCEAFAGRIDLPDAHNEAVWRKAGQNNSLMDNEPRHVRQKKISREDGQTFGTYLIIDNVRKEDYGEYICKISKPGKSIEQHVYIGEKVKVEYLNPNPVPIGKIFLCMSVILFLCLVAVILNLQYNLPLRVHLKDSFGSIEENDGRSNDILVLYSQKDSEIVLGVLLPTLETYYNYKCQTQKLSTNINQWSSSSQDEIAASRRIIVVISPAVLDDNWDTNGVYCVLKQLQNLGPKMICVTLKKLPYDRAQAKNACGETLCSVARMLNVILWEQSKNEKFWLSLRLRLPPKRISDCILDNLTQQNHNGRLTSDSSDESLDNFV